jgi:hypothetical protein
VFSYPQTDESRDNVPAFYLEEVTRAMGGRVERRNNPRTKLTPDGEACLAPADIDLAAAVAAPREYPAPVVLLTEQARDGLRWPVNKPLEPKELRDALQCPFRFFVRRNLELYSNRPYSRWNRLRSLPLSVQLIGTRTAEAAQAALEQALEVELDQLYTDVPDWELALMRSGGHRLIKQWVAREFRSREVWPKAEESLRQNARFGEEGLRDKMPGDVPIKGSVAAISTLGGYNVVHLYESRPPQKGGPFGETLSDTDTLYYGLHLIARWERDRATAIEVETMTGDRTLMLLPRASGRAPTGRVQDGLQVMDLAEDDDPGRAVRGFHQQVKAKLSLAVKRIRETDISPIQGDHCMWCEYGELCRRSREYGEDESPFGVDIGIDED